MDPENLFAEQTVMIRLSNLLFGLLWIGFGLLVLYAICKWCGEDEKDKKPKDTDRLMMKPVYAHEIEPGIVILQNEEGDYFKILKEYDSNKDNMYGSVSCTKPEVMQPAAHMSVDETDLMSSFSPGQPQSSFTASAPPFYGNTKDDMNFTELNPLSQNTTRYGDYGYPNSR